MFRRPNTTPLQAEHARRQPPRMRSGGPKQSARTKDPRHFLHQYPRITQVFENLCRGDHVEVPGRKLCLLQLTVKDFETEPAHMLSVLFGNVESLRVPAILARGDQ